jgi:hypothetical protein
VVDTCASNCSAALRESRELIVPKEAGISPWTYHTACAHMSSRDHLMDWVHSVAERCETGRVRLVAGRCDSPSTDLTLAYLFRTICFRFRHVTRCSSADRNWRFGGPLIRLQTILLWRCRY